MSPVTIVLLLLLVGVLSAAGGAIAAVTSPAFAALAGLWTLSSGSRVPRIWQKQNAWRVLDGASYLARYEGFGDGKAAAEVITQLAVPTTVEKAVETCMKHRFRCELLTLHGETIARIEPDGTLRVQTGKGGVA